MHQLPLFPDRTVTLRCRSRTKRDERTGRLFEWHYRMDETMARAQLARIGAGTQMDPLGKLWEPVDAWIEQ